MNNKITIQVLIDFDNLNLNKYNKITNIIDDIINSIYQKINVLKNQNVIFNIRLYGGWDELCYDDNKKPINCFSKKAQDITAYISKNYPTKKSKPIHSINVELVRSLASQPDKTYDYTYRKRQNLGDVQITANDCCINAKDSIEWLRKLKNSKKCPHCRTKSSDIIWINSQKMVDMMIAMDLSFYANNQIANNDLLLVIVSDDDDFLPVIFQLVNSGVKIYHVKKNDSLCYPYYINKFNSSISNYKKINY